MSTRVLISKERVKEIVMEELERARPVIAESLYDLWAEKGAPWVNVSTRRAIAAAMKTGDDFTGDPSTVGSAAGNNALEVALSAPGMWEKYIGEDGGLKDQTAAEAPPEESAEEADDDSGGTAGDTVPLTRADRRAPETDAGELIRDRDGSLQREREFGFNRLRQPIALVLSTEETPSDTEFLTDPDNRNNNGNRRRAGDVITKVRVKFRKKQTNTPENFTVDKVERVQFKIGRVGRGVVRDYSGGPNPLNVALARRAFHGDGNAASSEAE
jgi:hypothetical protein